MRARTHTKKHLSAYKQNKKKGAKNTSSWENSKAKSGKLSVGKRRPELQCHNANVDAAGERMREARRENIPGRRWNTGSPALTPGKLCNTVRKKKRKKNKRQRRWKSWRRRRRKRPAASDRQILCKAGEGV